MGLRKSVTARNTEKMSDMSFRMMTFLFEFIDFLFPTSINVLESSVLKKE